MRKHLLLLLVSVSAAPATAQKPSVDASVYNNWPSVDEGAALSPDGRYALYGIRTGGFPSAQGRAEKLVIQATDGGWRREPPRGTCVFLRVRRG